MHSSLIAVRHLKLCAVAIACFALSPRLASAANSIDFNRDIRPILSENCFYCHGPDKAHREADLRLDDREAALEKTAIVPGKADESSLITRIDSTDPDEQMPPADSRKKLTDEQKKLLREWIDQGAVYKKHWAYEQPARPEVKSQGAIDALVANKLQSDGLKMSPEADRRTLIRRLYFDLIGLPPTPAQVEAFVKDTSANAYEKLVDGLLASPHYGERMAMGWLDVVRFADTIGYHSDNPRNVWPYRDYVIRAFNDNKRFDEFTIEQLAGDLLPNSTQEQKVASCFNRLLLTTEEGGAQAKDYEARMLTDRVRAMGTVWLGQTLGCCQCHDHKFDPMTAQDFYAMGAFFADIDEPIIGLREAGMLVPNEKETPELARLRTEAAQLRQQYDANTPQLADAQRDWEKSVLDAADAEDRWQPVKPDKVTSKNGMRIVKQPDGTIRSDVKRPQEADTYEIEASTSLKSVSGIRLDVIPNNDLPQKGPGMGPGGSFVLSEIEVLDANGKSLPLSRAVATVESSGHSAEASIDGVTDDKRGWAVEVAGVAQSISFELREPLVSDQAIALTIRLHQNQGGKRIIGRFRLSATDSSSLAQAAQTVIPAKEILAIIRTKPNKRKSDEKAKLTAHFKSHYSELADLRAKVAAAEKAVAEFEAKLARCLVSKSLDKPRTVRILPRGNWMDESGPQVAPAVPHYLPQPKVEGDRRLTRLDLAKWVVAKENPLTARVFANRLWKQFFGIALSKTPDDIGSQGEWPVHPELLDWLACEFVDSGWDVKHLVRLIVMSQTYRQDSKASPELLARDPDNRLLARQSRFRLDAELVRDNALAISGLLVPTVGGPSVKPYQPDGYWENLNFPVRNYDAASGQNQYRRGLYTWWQRSFVHPSMLAFDAPTREECAADRSRSNIPQQALVLLNDPTYVEAARALAARIIKEGGDNQDSRIGWAWQQALGRAPREDEAQTAAAVLEKHRTEFAVDPSKAQEILKVGLAPMPDNADAIELAAWTSVARIILNLHETITRN